MRIQIPSVRSAGISMPLYDKLQDVQKEFEESLKKHKLSDVISDLYREMIKAECH